VYALVGVGRATMRRPIGLLKSCGVGLLVMGIPVLLIQLGLWLWQPMFHNSFTRNDLSPFAFWARESPCFDDRGNAATADYRRNVLVVFLTEGSKVSPQRFWYPRSRQGGAVFPSVEDEDKIEFFVPGNFNTLSLFGADGTRRDLPLARGEAERIYRQMQPFPRPAALGPLLQRAYASEHAAASCSSLREAIAALRTEGR
jgi:hypothetical protein